MSGKRVPGPAPVLPGFTHLDSLGSGGFADVFLYEQQLPRRRVAVKVLHPERVAGAAAEQFAAEANVMALLSTHPAIVTIYQAGVSDDGRSYLVMEYCPKPNLQVRSRTSTISIAEALRVGIQVAAAVETAHRAGILHRDIKPANILVTEYNRPALTDFGIATTADTADPSTGMSIPWSPPEAFADVPEFGVRSDVWALGATMFTLLAGRSPFEVPGGPNGAADLMRRIEAQALPRLERPDVPASLQTVLERSMAKRADDRYDSAVAFARALQKVQIELAHSVTPIDILDDAPVVEPEDDDGELTRVRGIVSIDPSTAPAAGPTWDRASAQAATAPDHTVLRAVPPASAPAPVDDATRTAVRVPRAVVDPTTAVPSVPSASSASGGSANPEPPAGPVAERASKRGLWIGVTAAAIAAVLIVGGVVLASLFGPEPAPQRSATAAPVDPQDPAAAVVPSVTEPQAEVRGDEVVFTWTHPDPQEGDVFLWQPVTLEGTGDARRVDEPTVTVPASGERTCIEVSVRRTNGTAGEPVRICTP